MRTSLRTHEVTNQSVPFEDVNLFELDLPLREALEREGAGWAVDRARDTGAVAGSAEAVVGEQPRLVALGTAAVRLGLGGARHHAAVAHAVHGPARTLPLQGLLERDVGGQQVDVLEGDGLVEDVRLVEQHGWLPRQRGRRR